MTDNPPETTTVSFTLTVTPGTVTDTTELQSLIQSAIDSVAVAAPPFTVNSFAVD